MQARRLSIQPVLNGFLVEIGCCAVSFTDIDKMSSEIGRYYRDPSKVEKEYLSNAINRPEELVVPQDVCMGTKEREPVPQRNR